MTSFYLLPFLAGTHTIVPLRDVFFLTLNKNVDIDIGAFDVLLE